ncbi:MAG TPA: hypothetical protein VFS08_02355 [Gemmatimonadaceae bacterium]|nr:hypothetical protein [Gemmatimonadaceae bacterium]
MMRLHARLAAVALAALVLAACRDGDAQAGAPAAAAAGSPAGADTPAATASAASARRTPDGATAATPAAAASAAPSAAAPSAPTSTSDAPSPPTGNYPCYYYGMSYALTSSSLTQVRVLDGARLVIAGDTVPFHPTEGDAFALEGGPFPGLVFHFRTGDDGKAQLVLVRKENEAKGHKIDVSDTYCYIE